MRDMEGVYASYSMHEPFSVHMEGVYASYGGGLYTVGALTCAPSGPVTQMMGMRRWPFTSGFVVGLAQGACKVAQGLCIMYTGWCLMGAMPIAVGGS